MIFAFDMNDLEQIMAYIRKTGAEYDTDEYTDLLRNVISECENEIEELDEDPWEDDPWGGEDE